MFIIENILLDLDCEKLTLIAADGNELRFELEGEGAVAVAVEDVAAVLKIEGIGEGGVLAAGVHAIGERRSEPCHQRQSRKHRSQHSPPPLTPVDQPIPVCPFDRLSIAGCLRQRVLGFGGAAGDVGDVGFAGLGGAGVPGAGGCSTSAFNLSAIGLATA